MTDALHPNSLPGDVRDSCSLSRSARPLDVTAMGDVDVGDDDVLPVLLPSSSEAIAAGSGAGGGGGDGSAAAAAVIVTASMIESELARERRHENEEYTFANGRLSAACRTALLEAVVKRESELRVELLPRGGGGGVGGLGDDGGLLATTAR